MEVLVVLCDAGVVIDKQIGRLLSKYLKQLIIIYYPRIGIPKRCTIYKGAQRQPNGREIIILPRSSIEILYGERIVVQDMLPIARKFGCEVAQDFLYDDQQQIISYIRAKWNNCLFASACLNLRAGYGKTFIAAGIIAMLRMRALYIVPKCELAKQTLHDLTASFGYEITIMYAKSSEEFMSVMRSDNNKLVCIAVINTVMNANISLARYFSLIIFDEVHLYCSLKRLEIFWLAQTRYMFGMSATIGDRRDGFDSALAHHLPPLIDAADIENFSYGETSFRCHIRAIRYYARNEYAHNLQHETTNIVFAHYMYEQFAGDSVRNTIIVQEARKLVDAGHNVFIFSEERAHIETLSRLFDDDTMRYVIFYGGVSDEERRLALSGDAQVILATYNYSGTGVSIIRMTAIILATPRYSGMKQIVGRILRRGSDPAITRIVVDIIDQKTCLSRQFRIRRNAYDFYGATYEKIKMIDKKN